MKEFINKDGSRYTFDGKYLRIYSFQNFLFAKINFDDSINLKKFLNTIEEL